MSKFSEHLQLIVTQGGFDESKWGDEVWKELFNDVDENVLHEATSKVGEVVEMFADIGSIKTRSPKSLSRVQEKHEQSLVSSRKNYFKDVCDLMALRVFCDVADIQSKIELISARLPTGSKLLIRGANSAQPNGSHQDATGKYKDITQYVYAYIPNMGVIEIQIGHEFAAHTFSIDSAIRDAKNKKQPCELVDLWNDNFYDTVKTYILSQANGTASEISVDAILEKAQMLHGGTIPEDLDIILKRLAPKGSLTQFSLFREEPQGESLLTTTGQEKKPLF